jgi:hypothetical protein
LEVFGLASGNSSTRPHGGNGLAEIAARKSEAGGGQSADQEFDVEFGSRLFATNETAHQQSPATPLLRPSVSQQPASIAVE